MYEFTSNLSSLFCCASFKRSNAKHDAPSDLRTFQPPNSTLSVPLPYNTVPHSSSDSQSEDARALHHIFSSSSSVRGYHTAATTPAYIPTSRPSLDLDFKFGGSSDPPPKHQGRVEQIGNHIKRRLSESRLSKASSRLSKQEPGTQDTALNGIPEASLTVKHDNPSVATSQSSAGLSEILASANASRGGYDSDAKSINSPVLRSDAGTIQLGKGFVKHALEQLQSHNHSTEVPKSSTRSSLRTANIEHPSGARTKGHSSPFPASPKKTSFAEALQIGKDESPKDLLRRLSAGIADGSIKMPDTPELRAACLPSIREVDTDWRLTAPKRSSSLPRQQKELEAKLQQLGEIVTSLSKENQPEDSEETKRTSLISELDPALLDYIDRYSQRYSSDSPRRKSIDPQQALQVPSSPSIDPENNQVKCKATTPAADTDRDSIHLFNMRISQRLASRPRIPVMSPTSSLNASARSLMIRDEPEDSRTGLYDLGRRPGPVMREHNRRPSDPQTRALFESKLSSRDPSQSWKTITPAASTNSYAGLHSTAASGLNNASSCYLSNDVPGEGRQNKKAALRRSLNVNPHSLAVGGRSVSVTLSTTRSERRSRHLSPADSGWSQQLSSNNPRSSEDSWDAPVQIYQRGRSMSMPQKRPQREHVSPTPQPKRSRQATDDAEYLSEISLQDVLDRRNERLTEISLQSIATRRDELFSETDHTTLPAADGAISRRSGDGRVQEHYHVIGDIPKLFKVPIKPGPSSDAEPKPPLKECATDLWERAFRQAGGKANDLSHSLLGPPATHQGRRRSIGSIDSNTAMDVIKRDSIGSSRRSRSVDDIRQSLNTGEGSHLRHSMRVSFPTALPDISTTSEETLEPRGKAMQSKQRKKSILDLKRHFTGGLSNSSEAASTPFKELINIWSRFPSHNRAERNGSAGIADNVDSTDFVAAAELNLKQMSSTKVKKGKMKSMTASEPLWSSPAGRARKSRKGILGKWKRIYRSSSTDLRKYAYDYGHRSSISVGDPLEYPELEILPGKARFAETDVQRLHRKLDVSPIKVDVSRKVPDPVADEKPRSRLEAVDWGKYYGDCVGSLSALKSESDLDIKSALSLGGAADVKSLDMRDSTINFQEALGREQQKLKQELIDKFGKFDGADNEEDSRGWEKRISSATDKTSETILASSIKTRDLQIPGSFG